MYLVGMLMLALQSIEDAASQAVVNQSCRKVVLTGEVQVGQSWGADIGEGLPDERWRFRLVPITPSGKGYTGWDLVMDTEQGAGYPDALLLGTPPYGSLNEREVGTTFGLRAQDAIAWGPRRFHFLTAQRDVKRGRELFAQVTGGGGTAEARGKATEELLGMVSDPARVGAGELVVQDARLVIGVGDPAEFAQQWAVRLREVPHTTVQAAGVESARGELQWIRFAMTLWVPARWRLSAGVRSELVKCPK